MEQAIISGVVHDRSEAKITIVGVPDRVGEAARIFTAVADAEINIDMIVQNVSAEASKLADISFTLPKSDGPTALAALEKVKHTVGFSDVRFDQHIGGLPRCLGCRLHHQLDGGRVGRPRRRHVAAGPAWPPRRRCSPGSSSATRSCWSTTPTRCGIATRWSCARRSSWPGGIGCARF
jgi:predicted amino acid-binding ACT domain protein